MPVLAHARPTGLGDDAVEGLRAVAGLDLDRGIGADQRVEVEVGAGGQRLDPVFEQLVEMVGTIEAKEGQNIGSEFRHQTTEAFGLTQGSVHREGSVSEYESIKIPAILPAPTLLANPKDHYVSKVRQGCRTVGGGGDHRGGRGH